MAKAEKAALNSGIDPNLADFEHLLARNLPARPPGELIWMHATGLAGHHGALDLLATLREERPNLACLLTGSQPQNAPVHADDGLTISLPLPVEAVHVIDAFLAHWAPQTLCWIGDGFRPGLMSRIREARIPSIALQTPDSKLRVDASRISRALRKSTLSLFDFAIVDNASTAAKWHAAGLDDARVNAIGVLEGGGVPHKYSESGFATFVTEIGTRPVWFANHVTQGEVADVFTAHAEALRYAHRLLMIITPEDEAAYSDVFRRAQETGQQLLERIAKLPVTEEVQILLTDPEVDESDIWYRAAPVSYLGRSLTQDGGVSPFPAASYGSAILHGPHVSNYASEYTRLIKAEATRTVHGGTDFSRAVCDMLAPDIAARAAHAAWKAMSNDAEVLTRATHLLHDMLDMGEVFA